MQLQVVVSLSIACYVMYRALAKSLIRLRKRLGISEPTFKRFHPIRRGSMPRAMHATADGVHRALSTNTDLSIFGLLL